ncbi:MAG: hypothetical protein KGH91_00050 [Rhodospirillales bacterium]|nr:hypothetical protein [Rhodospirillales bacterium]
MNKTGMLMFASALLAAPLAMAQMAPQTSDGALPGNDIGTRSSLPRSPNASNINSGDMTSTIAPTPPAPDVPPGSTVSAYLTSASQSLSARQTGTADEALEEAETAILQRSVPASMGNMPSSDPVVAQIEQARQDIGDNNDQGALATIQQILASNAPELNL